MTASLRQLSDRLAYTNAQLELRMAQAELREPIMAEVVTTRFAATDGNDYAECRVFDRRSPAASGLTSSSWTPKQGPAS